MPHGIHGYDVDIQTTTPVPENAWG